jgi:protein tyrosine phosphatase (PTP) superfamily phosphohydrolase (DUF442 family)
MLEDIYNFLPLTETLLSSGMPTAGQIVDLSKAGVRLVINLAPPSSEKALPREAELVESQGMKYIGIPVDWDNPTPANLQDFIKAMDANKDSKTLVHCVANYRATGFITLYRILRLGWRREDAFRDLRRIWDPDDYPVWKKFLEENLSVDQ